MTESKIRAKKIVYLSFATLPSRAAHAVNMMKMCEALAKIGHDVILFANCQAAEQDIMHFYGIKHDFSLRKIRLINIRFAGRIISFFKMIFIARRMDADIVYTRDLLNGMSATILKLPFIFELHEIPQSFFRKVLLKRIMKNTYCMRFVFISAEMESLVQEKFGRDLKNLSTCVAHDAVDIDSFQIGPAQMKTLRQQLELPQDIFLAGYSGSLFKGRGLDIILEIARSLKTIKFLIIGGEGKYLEDFQKKARKTHDNILSIGYKPFREIPRYLLACDLLLMPYQEQVLHRQKKHDTVLYMSPLKMFEYMATGKPIISSRISVLQEILKDGKNAVLVTPYDSKKWVEAIKTIKNDRESASRIGRQALQDAKKHTWDRRTKEILAGLL